MPLLDCEFCPDDMAEPVEAAPSLIVEEAPELRSSEATLLPTEERLAALTDDPDEAAEETPLAPDDRADEPLLAPDESADETLLAPDDKPPTAPETPLLAALVADDIADAADAEALLRTLLADETALVADEMPPATPPATAEEADEEEAALLVVVAPAAPPAPLPDALALPGFVKVAGDSRKESAPVRVRARPIHSQPTESKACAQTCSPIVRPVVTSFTLGCEYVQVSMLYLRV